MNIVDIARTWLGVPFRHQGRNRAGIDCAGLVVVCAREMGIEVEDLKGYSRQPDGVTLKALLDKQFLKIDKADMKDGDILLMKFRTAPQHLAIKTNIGVIHSLEESGKVAEHNLDDRWIKRIRGVYRIG